MHPSDYFQLMLLDHTSREGTSNKVWEAWLKQQQQRRRQQPQQSVSSNPNKSGCGSVNDDLPFRTSCVRNLGGNMILTTKDSSSFRTSGQSSLRNDQVSRASFPSVASTAVTLCDSSLSQGRPIYASSPDQHNLSLMLQAKQHSHAAISCHFPSILTDFTADCSRFRENSHYSDVSCSISGNIPCPVDTTDKMRGSSSFPTSGQSSIRYKRFANAQFPPLESAVETYRGLGINRDADRFLESSCDQNTLKSICRAHQGSHKTATCNFPFITSDFEAACRKFSGLPGCDDATRSMSRHISCPGSLNRGERVSSSFPTDGRFSLRNKEVANAEFSPVESTMYACCASDINNSDADLSTCPQSSRNQIKDCDLAAARNFRATGADATVAGRKYTGIPGYDDAARNISRRSSSPYNVTVETRVSSSIPTGDHSSLLMNQVFKAIYPSGSSVDNCCDCSTYQGHEDLSSLRASSPDRNMMNSMRRVMQDSDVAITCAVTACGESRKVHFINKAPRLTSKHSLAPLSPFWNGAYEESKSPSRHTPRVFPDVFDSMKMLPDVDESKKSIPPPSHDANEHSFNDFCPQSSPRQPAGVMLTAAGSEQCSPKYTRKSMSPKQKRKVARKKATTRSKQNTYHRSTSHYVITPSSATIVALSAEIRNEIASSSGVNNLRCSTPASTHDDESSNIKCDNNEFSVLKLATTMEASQRSQQTIHEWDKKFGLRRAHSKTMRESARSRTKVLKFLKGEGAYLVRGFPLMRMRNTEEGTATDTEMEILLSSEEDSIGSFSHDFSSHLDDQYSLADFEIFDLDGEDGELTKILQRALLE